MKHIGSFICYITQTLDPFFQIFNYTISLSGKAEVCRYCRGGRDTSEVRHRNIRYTQLLETLLMHFPPVLAKFVLGIKLLPTDIASGLVLFRRMNSSHVLS